MLLLKIPIKKPSYRERIAIQKKPKPENQKKRETYIEKKQRFDKLNRFLCRGISMYREVMKAFVPLSEEQKICVDNINKFLHEMEIVQNGTDEEREEVYEKYGKYIS